MNVKLLLQISVAALVALGTLLLGIGQANMVMPAVAVFAAVTGVYFTDITGKIRLNRRLTTLAAMAALAVSIADFFRLGRSGQLLAIANLLMYLQVVLMYQEKDWRVYWQLLMLSLLQVVVASALSFSLLFGFLLVVYMFLGLFVLSLFFVYREGVRFRPVSTSAPAMAAPRGESLAAARGFEPVSRDDLLQGNAPRAVLKHVLWQGTFTVMLTSLIFFSVPRFGADNLLRNAVGQPSSVRFSETIELGKLGEVSQDPSSVMRVWFIDAATGQPYTLDEEPLFRGAIVDTYVRGAWRLDLSLGGRLTPILGAADARLEPNELPDGRQVGGIVLERIVLEKQRENTVFSIYPSYRMDSYCPVEFDPQQQQLIRKTRRGSLEFTLGTTGLSGGRQNSLTPAEMPLGAGARERLTALPKAADGVDPLRSLKQFAAAALRGARATDGDRAARARALEASLRDSPRFQYTLSGQPRQPGLDPVEDFIANNPRGHCEYFASALALMLRAQGIPARVVIGFKGGEYNSLGQYYQVQNLHAHAWVEAYLEPGDLPPGQGPRFKRGAWLRLDPTPGSDSGGPRSPSLVDRARHWLDYGNYLWANYVVGLDAKRQREAFYDPLTVASRMFKSVFSRETWTETVPRKLRSLFSLASLRWLRDNWLSWPVVVGIALFAASSLLVYRVARLLMRQSKRRVSRRSRNHRRREAQSVPFYSQMETLFSRHGLRRAESQTQHEFATALAAQFVESPRLAAVAWLPRRVVDAFYQVRFGRRALDKAETQAVEQALRELAAALSNGGARR